MSSTPRVGYHATTQQVTQEDKLASSRRQVAELTDIMHKNVNLVLERDVKLENLERNASNLNFEADMFQKTTTKVRRWAFLQNAKWTIILILVIVAIIAIIIGLSVGLSKKDN